MQLSAGYLTWQGMCRGPVFVFLGPVSADSACILVGYRLGVTWWDRTENGVSGCSPQDCRTACQKLDPSYIRGVNPSRAPEGGDAASEVKGCR